MFFLKPIFNSKGISVIAFAEEELILSQVNKQPSKLELHLQQSLRQRKEYCCVVVLSLDLAAINAITKLSRPVKLTLVLLLVDYLTS